MRKRYRIVDSVFVVILAMLLCLALAVVVMAFVLVPSMRSGREVLTERGEQVAASIKERSEAARLALPRSR